MEGAIMARIKHIALTTKDPAKVAEFYKSAFGLTELRRSPNGAVFLSDGHINVAILNTKGEESSDMGAHGPHFTGIHHFGFEVDDLEEACQKLESAHGEPLTGRDHVDRAMAGGARANVEMKWAGPDGVVIDISHTGWEGTD
jgi:catechol 2,3-dioxygenase-like lactoylglutathione lyase family enzyme